MAVRSSFTAGEVLTAADLTDTFAGKVDFALAANAQSGTGASAYTFVLADASRLTTATGTTAKTFTIPPQANVAWVANSIIRVANYGAGNLTIAGGSGVTVTNATKTLAQFESAALVRTGSNAWTLIPFSGGAGNADFSNAATGTYTDGNGVAWKYITINASGTFTISRAGFADLLAIGGGAGGAYAGGGGGGGGHIYHEQRYMPAGTYTVSIGGGGAGSTSRLVSGTNGGETVMYLSSWVFGAFGGGGAGGTDSPRTGSVGACGGGGSSGGADGAPAASGGGILGIAGGSGGIGGSSTAPTGGQRASGGGGGYGANGGNATSNQGGAGGSGGSWSITGTATTYGGGGGGGSFGTGGSGGSGGGGAGQTGNNAGGNGTVFGAGGGGGGLSSGGGGVSVGGNGGNGLGGAIIVRVRV